MPFDVEYLVKIFPQYCDCSNLSLVGSLIAFFSTLVALDQVQLVFLYPLSPVGGHAVL